MEMAWGPEMPTRSALAAAGPLPCREATALFGAMDGPEGQGVSAAISRQASHQDSKAFDGGKENNE